MNARFWVGLLALGFCLSSGATASVTSTATYDLSVTDSVDTPSRTISFDGKTHEVSAVATATPGETLRVSVSAPDDADYRVNLYNGDRQVTAQQPATGTTTVQFDLTDYKPGSYMLLLYKDGDYKDAYPVVIQGYETTVNVPSRASTGTELNVTVTTENVAQVANPSSVKVVLATDEQTVQATATSDGSEEYSTTISLADVRPGQARIYAVVQGSDDAFKDGRKELLGISDAVTLTIEEPTTPRTTEPTESSDTSTTDQADPVTSPTRTTTTVTTIQPSTSPTTANTTSTSTTYPTTTTTSVTTDSQSTSTIRQSPIPTTTTVTTTDSAIITPGQSTTTTSEPSGHGVPGFGLGGGLVALCGVLILLLRR